MANTAIRVSHGVFPADTSTFDITISGETRTPTGAVVLAVHATALATNDDDLAVSFGVSDFTTTAVVGATSDHNDPISSDVSRIHNESTVVNILVPGAVTVSRSATVAAIAGGLRFTPVQSGTAYRIMVIIVFGSACKAWSSNGDGNLAIDETFAIAHGLTTKPKAGIVFYNEEADGTAGVYHLSSGFFSDDGSIKQAAFAVRQGNGQTTTDIDGRHMSNRVAIRPDTVGAEAHGLEITANDATNTTFTQRTAATTNKYIGLLIECDDISVDMQTINSPTSAVADWNFNGLAFQSQCAMLVLSRITAIDSALSSSPLAGAYGVCCFDEAGAVVSVSSANEDGVVIANPPNTNTSARIDSTALFSTEDDATTDFDMDTFAFTTDGWDVLAADINTADTTIRKWPMLAFGQASKPMMAKMMNEGHLNG